MKWSMLIVLVILLTSVSGCLSDDSGSTTSNNGCLDVGAPSPPEPTANYFSGSSDTATEFVYIEQNIFEIAATHEGSSNFIVWLVDINGNEIDLLFNEIGSYEGSHYIPVTQGIYAFNVDAGGAWSLTIEQPRPITSYNAPEPVAFSGDTAFDPVHLECGLTGISLAHSGDSNFIVWLYDANGRTIDLLANEIGDYEGSSYINIPREGVYLIDVTAGGAWAIAIVN